MTLNFLREFDPTDRSWTTGSIIRVRDDLAALPRAEGPQDAQVGGVLEELHRAVGEGEVRAAAMVGAEAEVGLGAGLRRIGIRVHEAGPGGVRPRAVDAGPGHALDLGRPPGEPI